MGEAKQLLRVGAGSLVRRVAQEALGACTQAVVVVGAEAQRVEAELEGLPIRVARNAGWQEGIASSIRCGVLALPEEIDAAILAPCDQPSVSRELFREMIRVFQETRKEMVACRYGGTAGAPALFARARFPQLLALRGDVGARAILRSATDELAEVEFPEGVFDLDTPEDLARWRARPGR